MEKEGGVVVVGGGGGGGCGVLLWFVVVWLVWLLETFSQNPFLNISPPARTQLSCLPEICGKASLLKRQCGTRRYLSHKMKGR